MEKYLEKLYEKMSYYLTANKQKDIKLKLHLRKNGIQRLFFGIKISKEEIENLYNIDERAKLILTYIKNFCAKKGKVTEIYKVDLHKVGEEYFVSVTYLQWEH